MDSRTKVSPFESHGSTKNWWSEDVGFVEDGHFSGSGGMLPEILTQDLSLMWLRYNIFLLWRSDQQLLQSPNDVWQDFTCRDHDAGWYGLAISEG